MSKDIKSSIGLEIKLPFRVVEVQKRQEPVFPVGFWVFRYGDSRNSTDIELVLYPDGELYSGDGSQQMGHIDPKAIGLDPEEVA